MTKIRINKGDLLSLVNDYKTKIDDLSSNLQDLISTLEGISDDSKISGVSSKANSIASGVENIKKDYLTEVDNLNEYVNSITNIDETDPQEEVISISSNTINTSSLKNVSFASSPLEMKLGGIKGNTIILPAGLGTVCTYMGWQCITATSSNQYKLREAAGMNFDSEGYGKINDRFVIATTTTYGNVGDYLDVKLTNGNVIKCVIGDIKNQNDAGCNEWGHNNGQCVVEFVVDKNSWYGTNKTVNGIHPEFNKNITKIVNKGNYFDLIQTDAAKIDNNSTDSEVQEDNSDNE